MSSPSGKTVVVAMSGGVDSTVSALLLKQQGYRVIGMFMKNWDENDDNGVCQASLEFDDVKRVCDQIGIPYYAVNFVKEYWDNVFTHFLKEFEAGHTPNPDILCNREIKFKVLFDKAIEYGADYLATGHYCQVGYQGGEFQLVKGADSSKDQSYFLYAINSKVLPKVLFPIGGLNKSEVRRIAEEHSLANAKKKDSTGICFIGERKFKTFLSDYISVRSGNFETLEGKVVGSHDGVAYYTIGQRKGIGIGGEGDAWFVVGKDIPRNVVYVEQGTDHPALFSSSLVATEATWISPKGAPQLPYRCMSKIRYRQKDQECIITKVEDERVFIDFPQPQRAVTPRQSIVFYDGDICLGGAIIERSC